MLGWYYVEGAVNAPKQGLAQGWSLQGYWGLPGSERGKPNSAVRSERQRGMGPGHEQTGIPPSGALSPRADRGPQTVVSACGLFLHRVPARAVACYAASGKRARREVWERKHE